MAKTCRRLLRRGRVIAPLVVVAAALVAAGTMTGRAHAREAAPVIHGYISATFRGEVTATYENNNTASDTTYGSFWEWTVMPFEVSASGITLHQANEIDYVSGSATESKHSPVYDCSAIYDLLEHLHPHATTTSGPRFWTSSNHGVFQDPGPGGILVTAAPFWNDFERTSNAVAGCLTATSPSLLYELARRWNKTLMCVPHRNGVCGDLKSLEFTQTCAQGCKQRYAGEARLTARSVTEPDQVGVVPFATTLLGLHLNYFLSPDWLKNGKPGTPFPPHVAFPAVVAPDDGTVVIQVKIGGKPIVQTTAKVARGTRATLPLTWSRTGFGQLQRIAKPTRITATVTFTPGKGKPLTLSSDGYVLPVSRARPSGPPPSGAAITAVSFAGTAANPQITIHGRALGKPPSPNPPGHPAGQHGCPAIAGDNGYDYGTSLYIAVPAKNWAGGRYRPGSNELDCIDLVVSKFTPTEVAFHFGPFYAQHHTQFSLDSGDAVQVAVNGALLTVHVKYGATVTS